jgi:hypothetical protein
MERTKVTAGWRKEEDSLEAETRLLVSTTTLLPLKVNIPAVCPAFSNAAATTAGNTHG